MARLIEGYLKYPNGDPLAGTEITFTSIVSAAQSGVIANLSSTLRSNDDGFYSASIEEGIYDIAYTSDGQAYTVLGRKVAVLGNDAIDILSLISSAEIANNPSIVSSFQALIESFNTVLEEVEGQKAKRQLAFTQQRLQSLGDDDVELRLNTMAEIIGDLSGMPVAIEKINMATDDELAEAIDDLESDLGTFTEFKDTFNAIFNVESQ